MNELRIEEDGKTLCLYVIFELKDSFRAIFKTAKWDRFEKCWEVKNTAENKKKWTIFVDSVSDTLAELKKLEDQDATEDEIKELNEQIAILQSSIASKSKKADDFILLKEKLIELRVTKEKEIKKEGLLSISVNNANKSARIEAEALMNDIGIDLDSIYDDMNIMSSTHNQVGSSARNRFNEASVRISEEYEKLQKVGIYNRALSYLSDANFNRPDRDSISLVENEWFFEMSKNDD